MLEQLFNEIEVAVVNGFYTLALGMTLCIPDICAALESPDGKTSGRKYKDWYNRYIKDAMPLDGDDCYYFRCAFLHQGSTQHDKSKFKQIIFVPPIMPAVFHNNEINGVLNIDLKIFCNELIKGARKWLNENKDTEIFKKNYEKSFRLHPNGLSPYIVGLPVFG